MHWYVWIIAYASLENDVAVSRFSDDVSNVFSYNHCSVEQNQKEVTDYFTSKKLR